MKLHKVLRLDEALLESSDLPRWTYFYLEGDYPWTADSLCYIVEFESEELETEIEFEFMNQYGVKHVEQTTEVDMTMAFALEQFPDATDEMLVESFNFYWRNDAPLIFDDD
jgi:hypothetical protein